MSQGFAATSCDQIAARAGAGKASLYARYPNKEALFETVVRRCAERTTLANVFREEEGLPTSARPRLVANDILAEAVRPEVVAMVRMVIATARQFPHLAQLVDQIGWEKAVQSVKKILLDGVVQSTEQIQKAEAAARRFIAATFGPHQLRALLGDSSDRLTVQAAF
jgi:AcrR family transcriptional regulator